MLKKADALPNAMIIFNRAPFISVLSSGKETMTKIHGYEQPGSVFNGPYATVHIGDTAKIIDKPKKKNGINVILLEVNDVQAYFYWIEVYQNAILV